MSLRNFLFKFFLPWLAGSMSWYEVIVVSQICVVLMIEVSNSRTFFDFLRFSAEKQSKIHEKLGGECRTNEATIMNHVDENMTPTAHALSEEALRAASAIV
jgi:hypothetical protein